MSSTFNQRQGAARDQRTWSTTATHGSDDQSQSSISHAGTRNIIKSSSGNDTPFSIQRWLAQKPHEEPWNGLVGAQKLVGQVSEKQ